MLSITVLRSKPTELQPAVIGQFSPDKLIVSGWMGSLSKSSAARRQSSAYGNNCFRLLQLVPTLGVKYVILVTFGEAK